MTVKYLLLSIFLLLFCGLFTIDIILKQTLSQSQKQFLQNVASKNEPDQSMPIALQVEQEGEIIRLNTLSKEYETNYSLQTEQKSETRQESMKKMHDDELNFIVIGDFGYTNKEKPNSEQKKLGDFVVNRVSSSLTNYDFMLSVGDNVYPLGLESSDDKKADVIFEETFQMSALALDWYSVLGNHDLIGDMDAALRLSERFPYWKQTERYYHEIFNIGNSGLKAAFVFVHSPDIVCRDRSSFECYQNIQKNIKFDEIQTQIDWLDDTLSMLSSDNEIIWKIVVIHNAVFSAGKKHGDNLDIKETILPLLTKYKVDIILSGHDHSVQYLRMNMNNQTDKAEKVQNREDDCPNTPNFEYCSEQEFFYYDLTKCGEIRKPAEYNYFGSKLYQNKPSSLGTIGPKYTRYSTTMQHDYMHQFIMGNGGIKHEELCPVKQMKSEGKLRYGHSVSGIGEIKITQDKIDVNLISVEDELLYSLSVFRANTVN